MDIRKAELQKWKNKVGGRIEKLLKRMFNEMGSTIDVHMYSHNIGEFIVQLSNSH